MRKFIGFFCVIFIILFLFLYSINETGISSNEILFISILISLVTSFALYILYMSITSLFKKKHANHIVKSNPSQDTVKPEPENNISLDSLDSLVSKSENEILFKYFSCENFSDLESRFMLHLHKAIVNANLNPYGIKLHRLSSGTFNVDYSDSRGGCYVGKIDLSSYTAVPDKYAVMKNGQKRARRVLDSEEEAKAYMEQHGGDYIEFRPGHPAQYYMQYLSGKDGCDIHTIESSDFQDYVNGISHWIKYIKECQKPLKFD